MHNYEWICKTLFKTALDGSLYNPLQDEIFSRVLHVKHSSLYLLIQLFQHTETLRILLGGKCSQWEWITFSILTFVKSTVCWDDLFPLANINDRFSDLCTYKANSQTWWRHGFILLLGARVRFKLLNWINFLWTLNSSALWHLRWPCSMHRSHFLKIQGSHLCRGFVSGECAHLSEGPHSSFCCR